MKKWYVPLAMLVLLILVSQVSAYWVEFKPGTCVVGPPPNCVAGHWYWVEPSGGTSSVTGVSSGQGSTFHGHHLDEDDFEKRPSEVSCNVEREDFDINGVSGEANALAFGYQYTTDTGTSLGVFGSFDRSKSDLNIDETEVTLATLYAQFPSSEWARTSLNLAYSKIHNKNTSDTGSYGFGVNYTYNRFWGHGSFLLGFGLQVSRAILPEGVSSDEQSDTSAAASAGTGFGLQFGKFAASFEWFSSLGVDLKQLEDSTSNQDSTQDEPAEYKVIHVGGAYFSYLFTDFWGLTMGYKKLIGLESYEGFELTIGSSFRF